MMRSSLENKKESHLVVSGKFKQKDDVKMYIHLPDYDDFKRYDLGQGDTLNHVARKIYANSHKPSWGGFKTSLVFGENAQETF